MGTFLNDFMLSIIMFYLKQNIPGIVVHINLWQCQDYVPTIYYSIIAKFQVLITFRQNDEIFDN